MGKAVWQGYILSPCLFNICRVHHVKYWAGWVTIWNQDCQEKYGQSQICKWYYSNGRKWRGTGFTWWVISKESACSARDAGDLRSIPGSERSPGAVHGNSLQYSCLKNPMNRRTWQATVHGVAESQTWLNLLSMHMCKKGLTSLLMRVKKLAWNSTLWKLRSWHLVPSLRGK